MLRNPRALLGHIASIHIERAYLVVTVATDSQTKQSALGVRHIAFDLRDKLSSNVLDGSDDSINLAQPFVHLL